jgi:N-glycosylase/DNA lyase
MMLRFGKYRDRNVRDVPRDYLEWLASSTRQTLEQIEEELTRRDTAEEANLSDVEKIITAGYRQMARQCHPDVGGDTKRMQEINAAMERLRQLVRQT